MYGYPQWLTKSVKYDSIEISFNCALFRDDGMGTRKKETLA